MKLNYERQRIFKALTEQPIQLPEVEILNEDQRLFKCWGSVEVKDSQGEIILMDEFKRVMPVIIERGGVLMEMHTNRHVGKIINYVFEKKETDKGPRDGIILTCKVFANYPYDDYVWEGVKTKRYRGLSFGGFNKTKEFNMDTNADALVGIEGLEFSLVDDPSCGEATMEAINYFAKSKNNVYKGNLCMEGLTGRGFSETDAHNICYADDINAGKREPMIEKGEVVKPDKLDRCVQELMNDPDFKPRNEGETKEQAAFAVCSSAINMRDEVDETYKADIAKAVNYLSKLDNTNITKGGQKPMANKIKDVKKQDGEEMPSTPELTLESVAERMDRIEESLANISSKLAGTTDKAEHEGDEENDREGDEPEKKPEDEAEKTAGTGPEKAPDTDVPQDEDESPGDETTDRAQAIKGAKGIEKRLGDKMDKNFEDLKKALGVKKASTPRANATGREDVRKKKAEDADAEDIQKRAPKVNPYDLITGKAKLNLKEFAKSHEDKIINAQKEALGYN